MSAESDLSQTKQQILQYLEDQGGRVVGYPAIANACNISKVAVGNHCRDMDERGLINLRSKNTGSIIQLTPAGSRRVNPTPSGRQQVYADREYDEVVRAHYPTARLRISDQSYLPDEWRKTWTRKKDAWEYHPDHEQAVRVEEDVTTRIGRESVAVTLKQPVEHPDVTQAMNRIMVRLFDAIHEVQEELPCQLDVDEFNIATTHVALVNNYLAKYVQKRPDLDLNDFVVVDEETGKRRVIMDQSEGWPETEGIHEETAEEDMRFLEEEVDWKIRNKEAARRVRDAPKEIDAVRADNADIKEATRVLLQRELQKDRVTENKSVLQVKCSIYVDMDNIVSRVKGVYAKYVPIGKKYVASKTGGLKEKIRGWVRW